MQPLAGGTIPLAQNLQDYIWIEAAAEDYKRSKEWLFRQIREGKLTGYNFPGDRKTYLSKKELEEYLHTPRATNDK
jgi:hypothetical protein